MIAVGCDHGGYPLKLAVLAYLKEHGLEYWDLGCDSAEAADYPLYGKAVGRAVAQGICEKAS